ncbi:MAG: hypothetical protein V1493_04495 [Candidatus Diapherotrites archaeon]
MGASSARHSRPIVEMSRALVPLRPRRARGFAHKGRIALLSKEKMVSPEYYFLATGTELPGMDLERARRLSARFLSSAWQKEAKKRKGKALKFLPSFRERVHGGKPPESNRAELEKQANFAVEVFAGRFPPEQRERIARRLSKIMGGEILSLERALEPSSRNASAQELRKEALEIYGSIKSRGRIDSGLALRGRDKAYLAKDWPGMKGAQTAAIHEAIHLLRGWGLIEIDVPFAQAADRLYGLEQNFFKETGKIKAPTKADFDYVPEFDQALGFHEEPLQAVTAGNRLGQWLYQNIPESRRRWDYLYRRCMGATHADAMRAIGIRA